MAEVGRDLWRSSDLPHPDQAGPPRADCAGPWSRWLLNISKNGDITVSLGNLC